MATSTVSKSDAGFSPLVHEAGVSLRVWAPHADKVSVIGDFNDWSPESHVMYTEGNGNWYLDVADLSVGDEYKFYIFNGDQRLERIDPRARAVTNSIGNAIVHDPNFDWEGDNFRLAAWNELVIYELHIGTFAREFPDEPSDLYDVIDRLDYLRDLGINAIEFMPLAEFAGDVSWGYNPAHIYAVESAYGGPDALKELVKQAHRRGIGVILDVVYNHFGPSDLGLWQFDGWSENGKGGIYFYNDWRSTTPWGDTRPDYGREEVRRFILDNALMWLDEYHVDGLRLDMTVYMRTVDGSESSSISEGWDTIRWLNNQIAESHPGHLTIAEDLRNNNYLTLDQSMGGAGCNAQWDAPFVHGVRNVITEISDEHRSLETLCRVLCHKFNVDAFERVIYTESHDEVANGKKRLPSAINRDDPAGYFAQKRSTLAASLILTAPGIPMLFQGQEMLADGWFDDTRGFDWSLAEKFPGIRQLYHDLIALRKNSAGVTGGLKGQHIKVHHLNDHDKVIAFIRSDRGGSADDTLVIANLSNRCFETYRVGIPHEGNWLMRFNSDWTGYSEKFNDCSSGDSISEAQPYDGFPHSMSFALGPYSMVIYSQEQ